MEQDKPTFCVPYLSGDGVCFPVRTGNRVQLLVDTLETYTEIEQAINQATKSVWLSVSFFAQTFVFPSGKRVFDLLNSIACKGIEVRILFWRNNQFSIHPTAASNVFNGTSEEFTSLQQNNYQFKIRWDTSPTKGHCHHEKTWMIDLGTDNAIVILGGITLSFAIQSSNHYRNESKNQNHDLNNKVQGPITSDVHFHFVQRWNKAKASREPVAFPNVQVANDLKYPDKLVKEVGNTQAQLQRTLKNNLYETTEQDPSQWVGVPKVPDLSQGDDSIYLQYKFAITSAKNTIYIENQHLAHPYLMDMLCEGLSRGVRVVYVVPANAFYAAWVCRRDGFKWEKNGKKNSEGLAVPPPPYSEVFLRCLPKLATYPNFCLVGLLVTHNKEGERCENVSNTIYVHSKLMIVDSHWATLGSANLIDLSFEKDHTELNVATWGNDVLGWQQRLMKEHVDSMSFTDNTVEDFKTFQNIVEQNSRLIHQKKYDCIQGHAVALSVVDYGSQEVVLKSNY